MQEIQAVFDQVTNVLLLLPAWQQVIVSCIAFYFVANITHKVYKATRVAVRGTTAVTKGTYKVVSWPIRKVLGIYQYPKEINSTKTMLDLYRMVENNKVHQIPTNLLTKFIQLGHNIPTLYESSNGSKEYRYAQTVDKLDKFGPLSRCVAELHLRGEKLPELKA